MHVLVTAQVYPPEAHPTAVMVKQLARHLAAQGHAVTVVTGFPNHPEGRLLGGYRKRPLLVEEGEGVSVIRAWHVTSTSKRIWVRSVVMMSQMLGIFVASLLKAGTPDVVINYGPPLVGPLLSSLVAALKRAPLLTVIYDIYPDVAIETGKLRSSVLVAVSRWAERMVYARSSRILVLSNGFRRTLATKGVPNERIFVLPVWLEADEVRPADRCNAWRSEIGISPKHFVILYAGTIGIVSGAQVVVEAAEILRATPDLLFLFVGEGQVKAEVEAEAKRLGLTNMRFLPLQDRSRLSEVQATADLSLVTLAAGRGRTSVPSKVVGYMAAGRPVVASVDPDSDTAECLQSRGCGVVVSPGNARELADAIVRLRGDELVRSEMGKKGRLAFEEQFAAAAVLRRYVAEIERIATERHK